MNAGTIALNADGGRVNSSAAPVAAPAKVACAGSACAWQSLPDPRSSSIPDRTGGATCTRPIVFDTLANTGA